MIHARDLAKRFRKKPVLDGLDLELAPGRVTVLLGRNGSGKSTFLKLCLGLLRADAGTLSVCGHDPARRPRPVRQAVGFVPDKPDCYRWMTAMLFYRFLEPQYPTWNRDEVASLVDALGVPPDTPFRSLSRGEGRKAMLVAALAPQPELLLLDEPFAGLDPVAREDVLRGVIGALRDGERTVLCTTHDLDVAARIADDIAVLSGGRIVRHGPVTDVLESERCLPERMKDLLARTGRDHVEHRTATLGPADMIGGGDVERSSRRLVLGADRSSRSRNRRPVIAPQARSDDDGGSQASRRGGETKSSATWSGQNPRGDG